MKSTTLARRLFSLLLVLAFAGSAVGCSLPLPGQPAPQPEIPPPGGQEAFPPEEPPLGEEPPPGPAGEPLPPPEEPPSGEEPPPGGGMSDEEGIKQALLAELGWSESELVFNIGRMDDRFAEGGVSKSGEMGGGGMWLAAKDQGQWVIIHQGQDLPPCSKVDAYHVPPEWASFCWDENTGTSVQR